VVGRSTAPPLTTGWMTRMMTIHMRRVGRSRVSRPVLFKQVFGFNEVTELFFVSQSVGLVPSDEDQLVILDSVGEGTCCGY
jgi:hypothetical protein